LTLIDRFYKLEKKLNELHINSINSSRDIRDFIESLLLDYHFKKEMIKQDNDIVNIFKPWISEIEDIINIIKVRENI